jgi:hypothetical protein
MVIHRILISLSFKAFLAVLALLYASQTYAGVGIYGGFGLMDASPANERYFGMLRLGSPFEKGFFRMFLDATYMWSRFGNSTDTTSTFSDTDGSVFLEFQFLLSDTWALSIMPGISGRDRTFEIGGQEKTIGIGYMGSGGIKLALLLPTSEAAAEFEIAIQTFILPGGKRTEPLGSNTITLDLNTNIATFLTLGVRTAGGLTPVFGL